MSVQRVKEFPNGDLILFGYRNWIFNNQVQSSHFLIKTDSLGTELWRREFNAPRALVCKAIEPLADGGAILVGATNHPLGTAGNPVYVPVVWRVDAQGTVLWRREYGRPYYQLECLTALSDGSYALAGTASSGAPNFVAFSWLLRINADGDSLRSRISLPHVSGRAIAAAPHAGLVLVGSGANRVAEVQWLDSLDRVQWRYAVPSRRSGVQSALTWVRALAPTQPGQLRVMLGGSRPVPKPTPTTFGPEGYLAVVAGQAGGVAAPEWEMQVEGEVPADQAVLGPGGTLTISRYGNFITSPRQYDLQLTHYSGVPAVYEPDLCRTPPQANATYEQPVASPDSLNLLDLGTPGPQYAQLLHWRWELGDGTVVERTAPGWVRHRYTTIPAPGTVVRVTITNNLGCTSTQELYPWGRPTAAQQAQALAVGATLWPNPAAGGTVQLRVPGLRTGAVATAQVLDGLGRAVSPTVALTGSVGTLPVAGLAPGVYVVRVCTTQGQFAKRLLVAAP